MLSATSQLQRVEELLLRTGGVIRDSVMLLAPEDVDTVGTLTATLVYPRGHRLHVTLTVDVTPGFPDWIVYGFHLLDEGGRCVFRYDNAPHHPELNTFPHHKHVGPKEESRPHRLPTLHDILEEVRQVTDPERLLDRQ